MSDGGTGQDPTPDPTGQDPADDPNDDPKDPTGQDPAKDPKADDPEGSDALPGDESWPEDARKALREARNDAAKHRTRAGELQGKVDEAERAKMSELERAQADAETERKAREELEARLEQTTATTALTAAATQARFHDPLDAITETNLQACKRDKDGNVTNAAEVVAQMAKSKPHLVRKGSVIDAGGGNVTGEPQDMNEIIRRRAGRSE